MEKINSIKKLNELRENLKAKYDPNKVRVRICITGCRASGAEEVMKAFESEIRRRKLQRKVEIVPTGCHGFCAMAPVIVVEPFDIFYGRITARDVPTIVSQTLVKGEPVTKLLYEDPQTHKKIIHSRDISFYKEQKKIVLRNCGEVNPTDIFHYIQRDGYQAIEKVFSSMSPQQVIEEVKTSGLRGRGGAGFPTGRKWELAFKVKSDAKYLICNGDEGDPGAFMDRAVLEGDPHSIIEGMLIGAYAIGATKGFIYVRAEYPIAVEHLGIALEQVGKAGLLGENILGSGFSFDISIKEGAGAFVCGEETALIASIEGKRGMPRPRPPFPVESGLWGKPTCINNVETLANIAPIILSGGKWYAEIGTEKSKGTKVFALAGKVNNTGLVEVPMGISLRKIVFDIGGGIPDGRECKAIQTGGPSGGCIPAKHLDTLVDYDSLDKLGAIMGSGGMIVADDSTCIVDLARFFMDFIQDESCGKCVPCRIGTKRMLEILERITQGKAEQGDIEKLEMLGRTVKDSALCGLGQTGPNPILSTIRYFREEYEAHVKDKKCPAGVCVSLICYRIIADKCKGCGACLKVCSHQAISGEKKSPHMIDQEKCIKCGACFTVCKFGAIQKG